MTGVTGIIGGWNVQDERPTARPRSPLWGLHVPTRSTRRVSLCGPRVYTQEQEPPPRLPSSTRVDLFSSPALTDSFTKGPSDTYFVLPSRRNRISPDDLRLCVLLSPPLGRGREKESVRTEETGGSPPDPGGPIGPTPRLRDGERMGPRRTSGVSRDPGLTR